MAASKPFNLVRTGDQSSNLPASKKKYKSPPRKIGRKPPPPKYRLPLHKLV